MKLYNYYTGAYGTSQCHYVPLADNPADAVFLVNKLGFMATLEYSFVPSIALEDLMVLSLVTRIGKNLLTTFLTLVLQIALDSE